MPQLPPLDLSVLASGAIAGALVQLMNMIGTWKKGRRDDTQLILTGYRELAAALEVRVAALHQALDELRAEVKATEADCQRKLDELLARPAGPAVVQHITNTTPTPAVPPVIVDRRVPPTPP